MMKKINLSRSLLIASGVLSAVQVHSQSGFLYKAALEIVKETKFYKIDLSPQVIAKCKPDLADIRIFDKQGKQVSYVLKNDLPAFNRENMIPFPIIKSSREKDKQTHIILRNILNKAVNNLVLIIKNTNANRSFSLSGSDDTINWFVIKESILLDNFVNDDDEHISQFLSFAPGNYKYFQLTILGENVLPFNIIRAGTFDDAIAYGRYIKIPAPVISQRDSSNKKTYLWLKFNDKYQVNKMVIEADGLKYFKRELVILDNKKRQDNILLNDYLRSGSPNSFILNHKGDQLLIVINNEDDLPLNVSGIAAFQLNVSLLAYLQAGDIYSIYFDNSTLRAPVYDLQSFSDSAEENPSILGLKSIESTDTSRLTQKQLPGKNRQLALWTIITGILLTLCFFTFKMIKEVNSKNQNY